MQRFNRPVGTAGQIVLDYINTHRKQAKSVAMLDLANQVPPGIAIRYIDARRGEIRSNRLDNETVEEKIRKGARDMIHCKIRDFVRTGRLVEWTENDTLWVGLPEENPTTQPINIIIVRNQLDHLLDKTGHTVTCPWRPYHVAATSLSCPKEH